MTSISLVRNAALLLQHASTSIGSGQAASSETDIVKIANGLSGVASSTTKSASAVAGRFAVDTAPASGKIVIAGLGSADSWEQLEAQVKNSGSLSASEKSDWVGKLSKLREGVASAEALKTSALYTSLTSGALEKETAAFAAAANAAAQRNADTQRGINRLLDSQN